MKNAKPITAELLKRCSEEYEKGNNHILTAAVSKAELSAASFNEDAARKMDMVFSIDLHTTAVTFQKASGRCWIFAALNILREIVAKKCNIERFELSENYTAFWDKFEKCNYFLESIIDTASLKVGDRTLDWVLKGLNDGGQWDMIVSLVEKYGVVPIKTMPETYQSSNTRPMSRMLNMKLRKYAIELRQIISEGKNPIPRKEEMLCEIYRALAICFGKPVETFDFEYEDKDKNYHIDRNLTPHSFYKKYVGIELKDYISVINAPTSDKPYNKCYTVKYLGNVVEGNIRHLNVTMDTMEKLMIKQLENGEPVWFGSDCSQYGDRSTGIWDQDTYLYSEILGGMDFEMTKEERLDYQDSTMNHAMIITGVNIGESATPNRWKIENSWGDEAGQKGYFVMSEKWFKEFTYQGVINKKYLPNELKKVILEEAIELLPWDPMGSLAK